MRFKRQIGDIYVRYEDQYEFQTFKGLLSEEEFKEKLNNALLVFTTFCWLFYKDKTWYPVDEQKVPSQQDISKAIEIVEEDLNIVLARIEEMNLPRSTKGMEEQQKDAYCDQLDWLLSLDPQEQALTYCKSMLIAVQEV